MAIDVPAFRGRVRRIRVARCVRVPRKRAHEPRQRSARAHAIVLDQGGRRLVQTVRQLPRLCDQDQPLLRAGHRDVEDARLLVHAVDPALLRQERPEHGVAPAEALPVERADARLASPDPNLRAEAVVVLKTPGDARQDYDRKLEAFRLVHAQDRDRVLSARISARAFEAIGCFERIEARKEAAKRRAALFLVLAREGEQALDVDPLGGRVARRESPRAKVGRLDQAHEKTRQREALDIAAKAAQLIEEAAHALTERLRGPLRHCGRLAGPSARLCSGQRRPEEASFRRGALAVSHGGDHVEEALGHRPREPHA